MSSTANQKTSVTIWEMAKLNKDKGISVTSEGIEETIGKRLARLRKEKGITQGELAEMLEVTQPVVSDYERGNLRLHGQVIIQLSKILGVSADELLGLEKTGRDTQALGSRRFVKRVRDIEKLPKRDQEALIRTIDAFLTKAS